MLYLRLAAAPAGGYRSVLLRADPPGPEPVELAAESVPADLDAGLLPAELRAGSPADTVPEFFAQNEQSPLFSAIGDWLAGLVLRGAVGDAWDAESIPGQADLTVLDIEPTALQLLPWELMRRDEMRLFLDDRRVLVRARRLAPAVAQELVPIRLLVVEGVSDATLGTGAEVDGITCAIPSFGGRLDVRFLTEPSKDELWNAFRDLRPHILHYTGHGEIDPETHAAALRLGDRWLTRDEILNVMPVVPRVVVLNACRSAEQLPGAQSFAEAFLRKGSAAVIGMRGDIRGQAAGTFAIKLYQSLAAGATLEQATVLARKDVFARFNADDKGRDWCLPSLTLQAGPADVLPVGYGDSVTEERRAQIRARLYEPVRLFVDRVSERGKLLTAVDPPAGAARNFVLISGPNAVGKSWLVHWFRTRSALRGQRLRYVDLKAGSGLRFLPALDIIRDTDDDLLPDPVRAQSYQRYDYDLNYLLLQHSLPPRPDPMKPLPTARTHFPEEADPAEFVEEIFASFRAALDADSQTEPLLLVLDHWDKISATDFRTRIYPYLVRPIAEGELPAVRLIVVLDDKQRRDYWPSDAPVWTELSVGPIDRSEFPELARQLLLLMDRERQEDDPILVKWIANQRESAGLTSIPLLKMLVDVFGVVHTGGGG